MSPDELIEEAAKLRRGATLLEALDNLRHLKEDAEDEVPKKGYNRREVEISVRDSCEAGGMSENYLTLDLETGRRLLPIVEETIRQELLTLGIEIEKEG